MLLALAPAFLNREVDYLIVVVDRLDEVHLEILGATD
jgi:hypothetical protein